MAPAALPPPRRAERRRPRRSAGRVPPPRVARTRRLTPRASRLEPLVLAGSPRPHHPRTWGQENTDTRQLPPGPSVCLALAFESARVNAALWVEPRSLGRRVDAHLS